MLSTKQIEKTTEQKINEQLLLIAMQKKRINENSIKISPMIEAYRKSLILLEEFKIKKQLENQSSESGVGKCNTSNFSMLSIMLSRPDFDKVVKENSFRPSWKEHCLIFNSSSSENEKSIVPNHEEKLVVFDDEPDAFDPEEDDEIFFLEVDSCCF